MAEQQPQAEEVKGQAGQAGEAAQGPEAAQGGQEKFSSHFAALARKEKALRMEHQKIKAEKEALAKEREQFKSPGYVTKEQIMKNPIGILTEHGWSPNQIAEMLLNPDGGHQPSKQDQMIQHLLQEIEQLKGKTTNFESHLNERETKERDQAIGQIRNEAKILIDSDPAFETIKVSGKTEAVVEHIKQTYDEEGILLSVEEAAKEVEDALVEQAMKLASLAKIKEKLQPKEEIPAEAKAPQTKQTTITPKQQPTLTHGMVPSSAKQQLSSQDRVKRAILRAQGLDPDTGKPIAG